MIRLKSNSVNQLKEIQEEWTIATQSTLLEEEILLTIDSAADISTMPEKDWLRIDKSRRPKLYKRNMKYKAANNNIYWFDKTTSLYWRRN